MRTHVQTWCSGSLRCPLAAAAATAPALGLSPPHLCPGHLVPFLGSVGWNMKPAHRFIWAEIFSRDNGNGAGHYGS